MVPSEHKYSIIRLMNLLNLTRTGCFNPSSIQLWSVMTDEDSTLVKVASNMDGYYHCLYSFHISQLDIKVSYQHIISFLIKITFIMLQQYNIKYFVFNYIIHFY